VLEAAVYSKIVLFGPFYQKYNEATDLVSCGGGISFTDEEKNGQTLKLIIETLADDESEYQIRSESAGHFVQSHRGATNKIIHYFQEKRLLTN